MIIDITLPKALMLIGGFAIGWQLGNLTRWICRKIREG